MDDIKCFTYSSRGRSNVEQLDRVEDAVNFMDEVLDKGKRGLNFDTIHVRGGIRHLRFHTRHRMATVTIIIDDADVIFDTVVENYDIVLNNCTVKFDQTAYPNNFIATNCKFYFSGQFPLISPIWIMKDCEYLNSNDTLSLVVLDECTLRPLPGTKVTITADCGIDPGNQSDILFTGVDCDVTVASTNDADRVTFWSRKNSKNNKVTFTSKNIHAA